MIKITRSTCPAFLKTSSSKTAYNDKKVVHALWKMQYAKCCYCEMRISEEGHNKAVDHFRPRSVFKKRTNDWQNLLLVCAQCNGKKGDKFPVELTRHNDKPKVVYIKREPNGRPLIIDPSSSDVDPEDHIDFNVEIGDVAECGLPLAKNGSVYGSITIETIGLDRHFYKGERRSYLRRVIMPAYINLLEAIDGGEDSEINIMRQSFQLLMSSTSKFAALARVFARSNNLGRCGVPVPEGSDVLN